MRFVASKPHGNNQEFRNTAHRTTATKANFTWRVRETFDEIQNLTDRVQSTRRVGTARQFNSNEEENHG